ncbi:MAG: glycoside hydrolase family 2 TIM barrel-domain containing protein [Candidatus Izemoplasmatales bacterium]|nr:glycoside hydrolase family 2 TIM barrel-domain containing protein [Candidatus Izemoplasmatales bacterium]
MIKYQINKTGLLSKYVTNIDYVTPLNDYPRPQLVRSQWMNLNGLYEYTVLDKTIAFPELFIGEILVPFAIESAASGVKKPLAPDEKLWYRRIIEVPPLLEHERLIIHFGAIDYQSEIYINQHLIGKNTGGYLPFEFDISDSVTSGMNELIIGVTDPTDIGSQERGKQVLNPKGIWYTATSGIWQTIWMEIVNAVYITGLKIIPDYDNSLVRIKPSVSTLDGVQLSLTISQNGKTIQKSVMNDDCFNDIVIKDFLSWSPESPFLYDIVIKLSQNGILKDTVKSYFGMRKFSISRDQNGILRLFLNNKPYFQIGVLDQGYFPESILTPPTDQAMIDDILTMKAMGFNLLRKHIKVEPARWYYHCDRLGMLVWQDMPNGGMGYSGDWLSVIFPNLGIKINDNQYRRFRRDELHSRSEYKSGLVGMIDHLYNQTSICCWVPFNESWGQFDAKEMAEYIKQIDPSRYVDHASGWYDQGGKDFVSIHKYILKIKAPRRDNMRPFVLSEFGGYSMNLSGHVWDYANSFGYRKYETPEKLMEAYSELIDKQIAPLIAKGLSAAVYTQLSDVETEVNGLLTYDRAIIKMDQNSVKALNDKIKQML